MYSGLKQFDYKGSIDYKGVFLESDFLYLGHVMVMEFLGNEAGYPAPKLKDASLSESKLRELYFQIVRDMRTMFWEVKLTHADFSEYNILYHKGKAYYIDVSQSVENSHPNSLNFLRMDCTNISSFFRKNNLPTMTVKELFDFITSPTIDNPEEYLQDMSEKASKREEGLLTNSEDTLATDDISEETFKNVFIPQNLHQVVDAARDIRKTKEVFVSI